MSWIPPGPLLTLVWLLSLGAGCRPGGTPDRDSAPTPTDSPAPDSATDTDTAAPVGRWVWGDLHAHSRWSFDGCEVAADCSPLGELPAEQFLVQAAAEGLDFVALTDHAEVSTFFPEGLDGPAHDIWAGQQAVLAQDHGVLGVLGYEWTWQTTLERDGHPVGGHRTVLLSDPAACGQARVRADNPVSGTIQVESDGTWYDQGGVVTAPSPAALWAALDAASDACGDLRWLSFAHHTAVRSPQPTDWRLPDNTPVHERLVEIYSEHGSGECVDLDAPGCGWRVNPAVAHVPDGAVQTALALGHRLGFLAGTDPHDARPGSLADGPGPVGYWNQITGSPDPLAGFAPGGLSAVWVRGALTADSLFDGLEARATLATSGPRPETLVLGLQDAAGNDWPPGAAVVASDGPFTVIVGGLDAALASVSAGGLTTRGDVTVDQDLRFSWDPAPGDWLYLRLRVGAGDAEERLWASPWWAD